MEFSFDQDIAPLKRQYFPMLAGQQNFEQFMGYRQNTLQPMAENMMKMQDQMMRIQERDLAFKTAQLNYEREREKARLEREYTNPDAFESIDSILSSDKTAEERRIDLAQYALQNSKALQYNSSFAKYMTDADRVLNLQANEDAKKKAEEKKQEEEKQRAENAVRSALANGLMKSNRPEEAMGILEGTMSIEDGKKLIEDITQQEFDTKQQKDKAERQIKALDQISGELLKPSLDSKSSSDLNELMSKNEGMTLEQAKAQLRSEGKLEGESSLNFTIPQRRSFIRYMADFTDLPVEKIEEKYEGNDDLLHSDLIKTVEQFRNNIYGTKDGIFLSPENQALIDAFVP